MSAGSLHGFTAVVTGAGSGIGEATARLLATRGARVAAVGRTPSKLEHVATDASLNGSIRPFPADLRRPAEARAALSAAAGWLGGFDLLVMAAGIYREGPFGELTDETVDELVDSNLKAVVHTIRAALPWIAEGGCVVNVASMSSVRSLDQQSLYAGTKAGVVHFSASLARELAPRVRVTTVSPGPTRTPILTTIMPAEDVPAVQTELAQTIPLRRLAEPDEIAEAIVFLARAPFATGTHLVLDGGTSL
ncbi:MAG TPA: SDR family oxidoreductase [Gaiellaceae bacterium]|jgi:NAD(P)-dependent dehydrogenase (short-subunit alcohol dehydrogenase family)|nr:SDR family oxidoreductase [Gaiellaceae bacterium]